MVYVNCTATPPLSQSCKGLTQLCVTIADRLHLRAKQLDTSLKALAHKIIVVGLGIADFFIAVIRLFFLAHMAIKKMRDDLNRRAA